MKHRSWLGRRTLDIVQELRFSWLWLWRMSSSWMWLRVALVRTDVSGERIASVIRVIWIGELGATLTVTSNRSILLMKAISSSEMSVFIRVTRHHTPEDGIPRYTLFSAWSKFDLGYVSKRDCISLRCRYTWISLLFFNANCVGQCQAYLLWITVTYLQGILCTQQ
jgi:hypothetical protein